MTSVMDTTAFSAAMRNDSSIVTFLRCHPPGEIAVVPPVVAEIEYGIQRLEPGRKRELLEAQQRRLLSVIRVLEWTAEASVRFGTIKSTLESAGLLIDDFDIAIAAIALAHEAEVITANLVHFRRIEGLSCRHWTNAGSDREQP